MDNLFEILNKLLKNSKIKVSEDENTSYYLLNRWISMSNFDNAKISNFTFNRWLKNLDVDKIDFNFFIDFYSKILVKNKKFVNYIKKTKKKEELDEKNNDSDLLIAQNLEISLREKKIYDNIVEFLNSHNK